MQCRKAKEPTDCLWDPSHMRQRDEKSANLQLGEPSSATEFENLMGRRPAAAAEGVLTGPPSVPTGFGYDSTSYAGSVAAVLNELEIATPVSTLNDRAQYSPTTADATEMACLPCNCETEETEYVQPYSSRIRHEDEKNRSAILMRILQIRT
jgi:hypothetical protein